MRPAGGTILTQFKTFRIVLLILGSAIVAALALGANQRHHNPVLFTFACHLALRLTKLGSLQYFITRANAADGLRRRATIMELVGVYHNETTVGTRMCG